MAAVSDFLREATKDYRHLGENHIRVVLVHPRSLILPDLGATLGSYAQRSSRGARSRFAIAARLFVTARAADRTRQRPNTRRAKAGGWRTNVLARAGGGLPKPLAFSTLGLLAAFGRRTSVPQIVGANFSGFVAWFLWRSIYLSKLPRLEKESR